MGYGSLRADLKTKVKFSVWYTKELNRWPYLCQNVVALIKKRLIKRHNTKASVVDTQQQIRLLSQPAE